MSIKIRAMRADDLDDMVELINLPGVRYGTLRLPFTPAEAVQQRYLSRQGMHSLAACIEDKVIGHGGLAQFSGRRAHAGEIFLYVHDDFTGIGAGSALMTALLDLADHWLGLRRLELTVNCDNQQAIRLYERFGFAHEGRKRMDALRDGQLVDCFMMARLKDAPQAAS